MGRPPVLKWAVRGAWRGSARLMMACVVEVREAIVEFDLIGGAGWMG